MTGYACSNTDSRFGRIGWTVKSVNHRFLDVTVSMPPGMESFWHLADETVRSALSRGKVECSLSFVPREEISVIEINRELAAEVVRKADEIVSMSAHPGTVDPMQVLSWPGVAIKHSYSGTELEKALRDSLRETLSELIAFRAREGEKIKNILTGKMRDISAEIQKVRQQLPRIVAWEKNRMKDAVLSAGVEIDKSRLEQELILTAQRIDVAEELDRLMSSAQVPVSAYLVIPATAQRRVLDDTYARFSRVDLSGAIITKTDESMSLGDAIGVCIENGLPVSYVTTGQRVPEDLEAASADVLVQAVLDGLEDGTRDYDGGASGHRASGGRRR